MGSAIRRIAELRGGFPVLAKILAGLTVLLLVGLLYFVWLRPYQLTWGATKAEVERPMAGDEIHPDPSFFATRAITIMAPPEEVWPWLLQMGYGRAGYYGYDLLENLGSPEGIRSADEILPEFQRFGVGDEVPISAVVSMKFHAIEPHRHLIWIGTEEVKPGSFTWALYPLAERRTRLVSRIRWSHHWTSIEAIALELFTEFTDHIAVRKILQGVRDRAEGRAEPLWVQNVELFTFITTLLTFAAALLVLFLRRLTWRSWGAGLFSGTIWLTTWYTPVPTWLSVLLALTGIVVVCVPPRRQLDAVA